jgi:hypothetical protein
MERQKQFAGEALICSHSKWVGIPDGGGGGHAAAAAAKWQRNLAVHSMIGTKILCLRRGNKRSHPAAAYFHSNAAR